MYHSTWAAPVKPQFAARVRSADFLTDVRQGGVLWARVELWILGRDSNKARETVEYGHFSEDGREYIITRVPTPRPWQNFISNRSYGLTVDAVGAGYSTLPISPGNRVTLEGHGKVFYLRDRDTGVHWSLTWQPVGGEYESFRCRHGVGYSVFEMSRGGIESSLRVFVPLSDPVEVWTARLRNAGAGPRRLTLFPFVEWHLAPYLRPWDNYRNYIESHWREDEGLVVGTLWEPARPGVTYHGFAGVSPEAGGYDTEYAAFIGSGSLAAPEAVVRGACGDGDMPGDGRACAAFAVEVDLAPGEEKVVTLIVGFAADPAERKRLRDRYLGAAAAEEAFARVREHWRKVSQQPRIETPDPRLDRMTNLWLKANIWQLTTVLRENLRGYRDTLQDAMGVVSFDAERAREVLLTALAYQYPEGHVPRQFSYAGGPHDERIYNDCPLWIALALSRYLKETGDRGILDAQVPFFGSEERATVFEHARRAIDWVEARRGWHDLIRIDRGDWCDAFDQIGAAGKGVSVWLSQAVHLGLLEMAELCELRGEGELAARYRGQAAGLRAALEEHAWDGDWYLCAVSDRGRRLGAKGEPTMEIYLNSQSWAAIGRAGSEERIARALDSADEKLECRYGPQVFAPHYTEYDPDVGRISVLRPGCGENGTVYVHAAVFNLLANLMARRPDRALEILRKIAPMMEAHDPEVTQAAPYAYVNSYVGPCYPAHEGRTLTNWYTSSASWTLFAITDWMLGVRAEHDGLRIDPCLPGDWERASLRRAWRGAEYEVHITKPKGLVTGRVSVVVDGEPVEGNLIPAFSDGRRHRVEVKIAAPEGES